MTPILERDVFGPAPRPRKHGKPEAKVQKAVVTWLVQHGAIVAITDAGALAKMGMGIACGIPAGWGDITGCLPCGRFLMVECKAPKGRQSEEQLRHQVRIEKMGGMYILARSIDDLREAFAGEDKLHNPTGICID